MTGFTKATILGVTVLEKVWPKPMSTWQFPAARAHGPSKLGVQTKA